MNYAMKRDDKWFHFYDRATTFSFHYYVDNHFFFIDKFRENNEHSFMDTFLGDRSYLIPEFQTFFEEMFDYAKKLNCFAVITSLVSSFGLYDFKRNLKIEKLDIEVKRKLNNIYPWFKRNEPYHYCDLIEKYISNVTHEYSTFNYFVLRELKNKVECFHCEDHSHMIHCDGYNAEFQFKIREDGLYAIEKNLKMDLKMDRDTKVMIDRLTPYIERMMKKGKISSLFSNEYFFAEKSFRNNSLTLVLGKAGCFPKVIDFLLQHYSKRELELIFWKDLNFYGRAITHLLYETFPEEHFKILDFCFVVNVRTGDVKVYQTEDEYNKVIYVKS